MRGLFVTGTDTSAGKTYVVGRLAAGLRGCGLKVGIYKPVCSGSTCEPLTGASRWEDVEAHFTVLNGEFPRERICPQCFEAPLAPPVAARLERKSVCRDRLRSGARDWEGSVDLLLVEGAGGWKSPIADGETVADLAADLGWPVVIVAANRLGVVNQTLLTWESIRSAGLHVLMTILNQLPGTPDSSVESNAALLREFTPGLPLYSLGCHADLSQDILSALRGSL